VRKKREKLQMENHIDTVGVVGSTPIAPTISKNNTEKTDAYSAFWLEEYPGVAGLVCENSPKTPQKQKKTAVKLR